MIDTLGMLLCIAGYGFLSFGLPRIGFVISATGSGFWFMFGLAVSSNALILQSIAFFILSVIGMVKSEKNERVR
jgi:ABC-type proline/glycine betaine transport system permease subunit